MGLVIPCFNAPSLRHPVARTNVEDSESAYYPPRARWYGRLYYPWFELRRVLHLQAIYLPNGITFVQFVLSLVVPGYAFFASGRPILGWPFLGGYCLAALLFGVGLGYQAGSVGYGLMISAHASSIVFLEGCRLRGRYGFGFRLVLAVVTLLAVWLAVYSPAVGFIERHWIMPLRVRGNVIIVRRLASPHKVGRGDWMIYSVPEGGNGNAHGGGAVWVRSGFGWGQVRAVAEDRVEFLPGSFAVNGVAQAPLPHMPSSGTLVVPEKHWFIWPEFDINGHGNVGEANLSATMLRLATVSESQFIGKPCKHWFWRRQVLP